MTRGDRILVLVVACFALLSVPLVSLAGGTPHSSDTSAIVQSPGGKTVVDLRADETYDVQGRQGIVVLRVADGMISATHADCPDQVCVNSGAASPGRPIVCVPNGVSVKLSNSGDEQGNLDAVSR